MREIALDTETTGLDPATGHRIVEIGCVEMQGRVRTGKTYQVYLNPERDMPEEAYKVHGLSNAFLADKSRFSDIAEALLAFIAEDPLIIHNAQFDLKFLNAELAKAQYPAIPASRAVDTVAIARSKFPGAPASLDALCRRFNIDLSARTQHGALLDAELLADVYLELMGGRQGKMLLETQTNTVSTEIATQSVPVPYRVFPPTEEERRAHAAFLAQIKKPIWQEKKAAS